MSTSIDTDREWLAAYHEMQRAEEIFQAAVVRQFGLKTAGTMRYLRSQHNVSTWAAAESYWQAANRLATIGAERRSERGTMANLWERIRNVFTNEMMSFEEAESNAIQFRTKIAEAFHAETMASMRQSSRQQATPGVQAERKPAEERKRSTGYGRQQWGIIYINTLDSVGVTKYH